MLSDIFEESSDKLLQYLQTNPIKLDSRFIKQPRFVAEAVETIIDINFHNIFGQLGEQISEEKGAKSTGDFQFIGSDNVTYKVDIKTCNIDKKWNMGNIISTRKLLTGGDMDYTNDNHAFAILAILYSPRQDTIEVHDTIFTLLEWISWNDIHIQPGLGNGQLQFKSNALKQSFAWNPEASRSDWMRELGVQGTEACHKKIANQLKMKALYESVI